MVQRLILLICAFTGVAAAQSGPPRKVPPRKDIPAIAKAANGSVVSIVMSDKDGKPIAQGSGFFVSRTGQIVTNYHVIAEGSSAVAKLPNGAFYSVGGVLAADKRRDIAVIRVYGPAGHNFHTLTLGNSDRVQVGQEVVAIGNPLSLESTVSNGIVSGKRTGDELGGKFLQITAPISPGSSGGPLFNMAGEVIGITAAGLKGGENLNFAIPINDVKRLLATANEADKQWAKNFPNEQPKETQSEATHQKPTLEEQKMCSEQADKVLRKRQLEEKDDPSVPIFDAISHYDRSTGVCYVGISRTPTNNGLLPLIKGFTIRDAFQGTAVGYLIQSRTWDKDTGAFTGKFGINLCTIDPPGLPEIDCKSQTEFEDLAFKYFGIPK